VLDELGVEDLVFEGLGVEQGVDDLERLQPLALGIGLELDVLDHIEAADLHALE